MDTKCVHRKHIRQKLELHNDRELVAYARKWGLDQD
jgi:DNA-binding CsgD family transcriptional regulator